MIRKLLVALAVLLTAQTASAAVVARFDFDTNGQPENWNFNNGTRLVTGGVLQLTANTGSTDPQLSRAAAFELTRATGATWSTVDVVARELDGATVVPFDPQGTLLILDVGGPSLQNFGPPSTVSLADTNGFQTLTWDISGFAPAATGAIRLDFFGGPGAIGNVGQIESITFTDSASAIPEPSSLAALLVMGGVVITRRRRF